MKLDRTKTSFGTSTSGLTEKTFMEKGVIFQIGVAPRRIDLITYIDGVDFNDAYPSRKTIVMEGLHLPFISKENPMNATINERETP